MGFLDDYQPVEDRIRAFWDDHPNGQISTELVRAEGDEFIVKASVWRTALHILAGNELTHRAVGDIAAVMALPDATGYAQEHVTDRGVNQKSALENCETSAIGRALANLGYAPKGARPSREEMSKVADEGTGRPVGAASSYSCPSCGAPVQNNLPEHFENKKKPAWRCSNSGCQGGSAKKTGGGNWSWASWNPDEFRGEEDPDDGEPIREDYPSADPETGELLDYDPNDDERPF